MNGISLNTITHEYCMSITLKNGNTRDVPIYFEKPLDELRIRYFIKSHGEKRYLTEAEESELSSFIAYMNREGE